MELSEKVRLSTPYIKKSNLKGLLSQLVSLWEAIQDILLNQSEPDQITWKLSNMKNIRPRRHTKRNAWEPLAPTSTP